jgi:hypothetical protein
MISLNSLAAFTAEISRVPGVQQARGAASSAGQGQNGVQEPAQRKLDALPSMPAVPPPRGSMLDLRV